MIKIAVNNQHVGKAPKRFASNEDRRAWWGKFNGDFVNLDLPSVAHLIRYIRNGWAYTTQHRRYRRRDEFVRGQHIGIDFDSSGFDELLACPFIVEHASFLHTTASHTPSAPRTRAVFILERAITKKYPLIAAAFANHWDDADAACKDPVRLFFGAQGCDIHYLGNILSFEAAAEIVVPYKEQQRTRKYLPATEYTGQHDPLARAIMNRLIDTILSAPEGERHNTRISVSYEAGGHIAGGILDAPRAETALLQAAFTNTDDYIEAEGDIAWGLRHGQSAPLYPEERLDPISEKLFAYA